jgi:ABC-type branched-subunit amino acid transport system substrate-binding protein
VIQARPEHCQVTQGTRPETVLTGPNTWWLQQDPGLHGLYLVAGDLPETTASGAIAIAAGTASGIKWDATPKVSGADTQTAYTPRVEEAKTAGSTFVSDGSNDVAMIHMRKEAIAQGLTSVKVWACGLNCYTNQFIPEGGADVNGTYVYLPFLPFEEASSNPADQAFVTALGSKVTSWGAQAWQAALAFKQAVDAIVAKSGPNGLTRAALLTALKGITNFTADGWLPPTPLEPGQVSPCFVMMQVQNGKFVRVFPTKPGTFDCNPSNVTTVTLDPAAVAATLK